MEHLSPGQYLVTSNYISSNNQINEVKTKAADLIDLILSSGIDPRTRSLAITSIEVGAMWAVKSITKPIQDEPKNLDQEYKNDQS